MNRRAFLSLAVLGAASAVLPQVEPVVPIPIRTIEDVLLERLPKNVRLMQQWLLSTAQEFEAGESGIVTMVAPKPFILDRLIFVSSRPEVGFTLSGFKVGKREILASHDRYPSEFFCPMSVCSLNAGHVEKEIDLMVENLDREQSQRAHIALMGYAESEGS